MRSKQIGTLYQGGEKMKWKIAGCLAAVVATALIAAGVVVAKRSLDELDGMLKSMVN